MDGKALVTSTTLQGVQAQPKPLEIKEMFTYLSPTFTDENQAAWQSSQERFVKKDHKEVERLLVNRQLLHFIQNGSSDGDVIDETKTESIEDIIKLLSAIACFLEKPRQKEEQVIEGLLHYLNRISTALQLHAKENVLRIDTHDLYLIHVAPAIILMSLHKETQNPEFKRIIDDICASLFSMLSEWAPAVMRKEEDDSEIQAWITLARILANVALYNKEYIGIGVISFLYIKKIVGPVEKIMDFLPIILGVVKNLEQHDNAELAPFFKKIGKKTSVLEYEYTIHQFLQDVLKAHRERRLVEYVSTKDFMETAFRVMDLILKNEMESIASHRIRNINVLCLALVTLIKVDRAKRTNSRDREPDIYDSLRQIHDLLNLWEGLDYEQSWCKGSEKDNVFYMEVAEVLATVFDEIGNKIRSIKTSQGAPDLKHVFLSVLRPLRSGFYMPSLARISIDYSIDSTGEKEAKFLAEVFQNLADLPRDSYDDFSETERKRIVLQVQKYLREGSIKYPDLAIRVLYSLFDLALIKNKAKMDSFVDEYWFFQEYIAILKKKESSHDDLIVIFSALLYSLNLYGSPGLYDQEREEIGKNIVMKFFKEISFEKARPLNPVFYVFKIIELLSASRKSQEKINDRFGKLIPLLSVQTKFLTSTFSQYEIKAFRKMAEKALAYYDVDFNQEENSNEIEIIKVLCSVIMGGHSSEFVESAIVFCKHLWDYIQAVKEEWEGDIVSRRAMCLLSFLEMQGFYDKGVEFNKQKIKELLFDLKSNNGKTFQKRITDLFYTSFKDEYKGEEPYNRKFYVKIALLLIENGLFEELEVVLSSEQFKKKNENDSAVLILHNIVFGCSKVSILSVYLEYLKTQKVDLKEIINRTDSLGYTAWHLAVTEGKLDMAVMLEKNGADSSIPDKYGRTFSALKKGKERSGLLAPKNLTEFTIVQQIISGIPWVINPISYAYGRSVYRHEKQEAVISTKKSFALIVYIDPSMLSEIVIVDSELTTFLKKETSGARVFTKKPCETEILIKVEWMEGYIKNCIDNPANVVEAYLASLNRTHIADILKSFFVEKTKKVAEIKPLPSIVRESKSAPAKEVVAPASPVKAAPAKAAAAPPSPAKAASAKAVPAPTSPVKAAPAKAASAKAVPAPASPVKPAAAPVKPASAPVSPVKPVPPPAASSAKPPPKSDKFNLGKNVVPAKLNGFFEKRLKGGYQAARPAIAAVVGQACEVNLQAAVPVVQAPVQLTGEEIVFTHDDNEAGRLDTTQNENEAGRSDTSAATASAQCPTAEPADTTKTQTTVLSAYQQNTILIKTKDSLNKSFASFQEAIELLLLLIEHYNTTNDEFNRHSIRNLLKHTIFAIWKIKQEIELEINLNDLNIDFIETLFGEKKFSDDLDCLTYLIHEREILQQKLALGLFIPGERDNTTATEEGIKLYDKQIFLFIERLREIKGLGLAPFALSENNMTIRIAGLTEKFPLNIFEKTETASFYPFCLTDLVMQTKGQYRLSPLIERFSAYMNTHLTVERIKERLSSRAVIYLGSIAAELEQLMAQPVSVGSDLNVAAPEFVPGSQRISKR